MLPDQRSHWRPLLLLAACNLAHAATPATLPTDLQPAAAQLASEFESRLARVRYLESGDARPAVVPGWEGFPTRRYTYTVRDKDGTAKSADVILLDPTATQLADWIVQCLAEVRGHYTPDDGRRLFSHVIAQSGGQFPVAGVVYEDILPADGANEIYCFRDGVTVEVENVPHRGTAPLTKEQVEASINGNVRRVFQYARVQSTSPKMWIDAGGSHDVLGPDGKPTSRWRAVIREEYQKAWTSPRNALMVAWVKANTK
jgi:hypothetical protein